MKLSQTQSMHRKRTKTMRSCWGYWLWCLCIVSSSLPSPHFKVMSFTTPVPPPIRFHPKNLVPKQHQAKIPLLRDVASFSSQQRQSCIICQAENNNNDDDKDEDEKDPELKRMEMVRMIQKTFYQSSTESSSSSSNIILEEEEEGEGEDQRKNNNSPKNKSKIDPSTGKIYNLPLWRVNWAETPGRSNCLNVHELQYTHMFETILSQPKPWYVGHLYTPGGSKGIQQGLCELNSWRDTLASSAQDNNDEDEEEDDLSSKLIGTLLRITDYRRLEDGRLMILVHGLERFVVDAVKQDVPYATADVQILPDVEISTLFLQHKEEEEEEGTSKNNQEEEEIEHIWKNARTKAILDSFYYHEYECKNLDLPLPKDCEYLPKNGLPLASIARLLPFAFYELEDDSSLMNIPNNDNATSIITVSDVVGDADKKELALEQQLLNNNILRNPKASSSSSKKIIPINTSPSKTKPMSTVLDKLETLVWLALDDICINTAFTLPEEVLCLMPPHIDYLYMDKPELYLSSHYPSIRRQSRLSYLVPALLEKIDGESGGGGTGRDDNARILNEQRQMWLEAPGIVVRLKALLGRLEGLNDEIMGEFQ